jgi:hypothetical protein
MEERYISKCIMTFNETSVRLIVEEEGHRNLSSLNFNIHILAPILCTVLNLKRSEMLRLNLIEGHESKMNTFNCST